MQNHNNSKIRISLKNICKGFEDKKILDNLSFNVEQGKIISILGGSGSGKSVLLKIILGLLSADSGEIYYDGCLISEQNRQEVFLKNISVLFQNNALFDSLNIFDNIAFPFLSPDKISIFNDVQSLKKQVGQILEEVGLSSSIGKMFLNEISGGMQKRVALARALITRPQVIFLDEPTSGLDIENSKNIFNLIQKLNSLYGITFIVITHDIFLTSKITQGEIFILEDKKLNLITNQQVMDRFYS